MKRKFKFMAMAAMTATLVFFASCDKNDDEKQPSVLERDYFTVQNATIHQGAIPQLSSAGAFNNVTINRNVLPGGSSFVSLNSAEQISEIYVSVDGINEYFRCVPNVNATQTQSMTMQSATNVAQFVILFSQNLSQSFTIQISALLSNGSLTQLYTAPLTFVNAGTGALQVSLSFDNDKDVDLYVVQPDDEVIYYS
ncbi:MAG: hypothetical protein LBH30_07370, partial [Prevotellaceae bacterium]|nr:hypothetical protein [Prevotellaceae bacterium]